MSEGIWWKNSPSFSETTAFNLNIVLFSETTSNQSKDAHRQNDDIVKGSEQTAELNVLIHYPGLD